VDQRWGSLKPLKVDLDEVAAALEHRDRSETDHFLNLETGEVITLSTVLLETVRSGVDPEETDLPEWVLDDLPLAEAAMEDPHGRTLARIPQGTRLNVKGLRARFARAIKSEGIREKVATAIYAGDGGKRFRALLKTYPQIGTAWYRFEARRKHQMARQWLEGIGIEAT